MTVSMFGQCPECGMDWCDPDNERRGVQYSRIFGIYDRDRDRTVEYQCPGCDARWPAEEVGK